MRTVAIFCGNRAEFGLLQKIIHELEKCTDVDVRVCLSGALDDPKWGDVAPQTLYGNTVDHVIQTPTRDLSGRHVAGVVANIVEGMADWLEILKADILLVLGDRSETFAAVTAAYFMNIVIAHIHGGDRVLTDCLDTNVRHAITKLAHIHFPACADSRDRILRLGESDDRVFLAGSPAVEIARNTELLGNSEIRETLNLTDDEPFFLVTIHPENDTNVANAEFMRAALEALEAEGTSIVITYPNNDPGGEAMISELNNFKFSINAVIRPTLGIRNYLSALKECVLVIGNTSSGIMEAPIFKTPFVNIGQRQTGRCESGNVVHCPKYDSAEIRQAIRHARDLDLSMLQNLYEGGNTSSIIAKTLANLELTHGLRVKPITY